MAGEAAAEMAKALAGFLKRKYNDANNLDDNWTRLTTEARELSARRDDILAEAKKCKRMQITNECQSWISRVARSVEEVKELETKYKREKDEETNLRLISYRSAEVSKNIADKCEDLRRLCSEGEKFKTRMLVEKNPEAVKRMHAPNIEDKPSLYWAVEEILSNLRDNNVRRVGLWGMPGVGKTAIMQNLNNHEDIAKMFDIVIWITVSKDGNEERVQRAIIERLKLNVEGITDAWEIGGQISAELESKKYLLLLDEVWDILDLRLVGILDNSQKAGKVVLATRYRDICFDMESDHQINLKRLSEADANKIFREKVGPNVLNLPGIESIALRVVRECAGLPLLIDRVGRAFRKKNNSLLWNDGLRNLMRWPSIKVYGMDELIEFLKFCYEDLDGEDKKVCFLYNALYPEDYEINADYLLECWIAEDFIHDANEFRVAREKGHTILYDLLNVSLLEMGEKMNHVRMNKVLRNMALKISSRSNNGKMLVEARKGLQESPNKVRWQWANRISLMDNELYILPEMPVCSNLSTLFLQGNCSLEVIPKSFFRFMQNLRVLDLHSTGITSLPPSVSCLKCLRALYLNYCSHLMELPFSLKGLMHLEVLDIRGTGINHVPSQIGCLLRLKCLRMSISMDVELHRNVLSKLSLLEELILDLNPSDQRWEADMKSIIEEVATLKHLNSLSICFPGVDYLKIFTSKSHSWNNSGFIFQFSVGYHDSSSKYQIHDLLEYQIWKCFKYVNGAGADPAISAVLTKAEAFELIRHKGVSKLSDFGVESLNEIRVCLIEECDEIETIVDGNSITECMLRRLEKLLVNNVPKLVSIWEGVIHAESLGRLRTLTLCKCTKLKKIFSNGMIKQLSKLQNLTVEDCPEIEEIIMESENNKLELDALPSLKTLVLVDLSKVKSIWIDDSMKWSSLQTLKIFMCPLLTKLPFNNKNALQLRRIECQNLWSAALKWPEDSIKQRLEQLFVVNS